MRGGSLACSTLLSQAGPAPKKGFPFLCPSPLLSGQVLACKTQSWHVHGGQRSVGPHPPLSRRQMLCCTGPLPLPAICSAVNGTTIQKALKPETEGNSSSLPAFFHFNINSSFSLVDSTFIYLRKSTEYQLRAGIGVGCKDD